MYACLVHYNVRKQLCVEIPEAVAQQMERDGWEKIHRHDGKAFVTVVSEQEVDDV